MRILPPKIADSEEAKARARLLAHFVDHSQEVFYSRQLEVLFEKEFFHWVTNRALRSLIAEGTVVVDPRQLAIGSQIKLVWHKSYRFPKRTATAVFDLVNRYTSAATDGTLGMQGEHLVLAAFARQRFVLLGEELNIHAGVAWTNTGHDLDFIFERNGTAYGVEVKNTLGYMDVAEFVTKIRLARHIGVKPVFAVRALPRTWSSALIKAGGYAMVMGWQFYPWTHQELAGLIRDQLGLPVDTPKKIESGTMQRFENWVADPGRFIEQDSGKVDRLLASIEEAPKPKEQEPPEEA